MTARHQTMSEVLKEQLGYWEGKLASAPSLLELPTDHPRPALQQFRGHRLAFHLPARLTEALKQMSRREGVTLFMLLLAAFQALLSRYSGQGEVVVGTPAANRNRGEVEGLIGFFVNTLVIGTRVRGGESFAELLREVKEACLGAYAHQDVPFEKLVEELGINRSMSYRPLFQVAFQLEEDHERDAIAPSALIEAQEREAEVLACDLELHLFEFENRMGGEFIYDASLFEASTIARLATHFERLLESIVADPLKAVRALPFLTEAERRQIVLGWNDTAREYPGSEFAHRLFEEQAGRTPEATAIDFAGQRLSYRELDERANRLAHYLRRCGVKPEVLVGLCIERLPEMVIGLLGILKAGGAYVPLDPTYPQKRLAYILEDTGMSVLLTHSRVADRLPQGGLAKVISLDSEWEKVKLESDTAPTVELSPDNLAYAIYTSGSTGVPKGVLLHHRGLRNLARAQARCFGVTNENRVLQFASISFDASVSEIFKTLTVGATLCLEPADKLLAGPDLSRSLVERGVDMLTLPPSTLATLRPETLPELRTIIVAGEACSTELFAQWSDGRRFFNAYGPTEVTVCATIGECTEAGRTPPIGRPLDNQEVYLLDAQLQPVAVGVRGELYVGGVGLARGYQRQPTLTAERFIPHPFSRTPGARLYRTGDVARYLNDGQIEFLGRIDHQVKVRGFRIELGEIESVLAGYPAVKDCVAVVRQDAGGDGQLVAYLLSERGAALATSDLKAYLRERLAEYMIPTAFVVLEQFPLTLSGKVDRNALPAPAEIKSETDENYLSPRNELERLLADLWGEILGVERVSIHDNFFELGGDSLKAATFLNKLQDALGEVVYVVALFDAPVLADLAVYLGKHYRDALGRRFGEKYGQSVEARNERVNEEKVAQLRSAIHAMKPFSAFRAPLARKNPPAIFILSPPRSGSTLLRVMLGGSPSLFAPPELQLLNCNTLRERLEIFSGRDSFWLEGTVRAVMDVHRCDAETAKQLIGRCETDDLSVPDFYRLLQGWASPRLLVDKTPAYALDTEVLRRAEQYFDGALFIHLLRHPLGMIKSFEEAKLDQIFRYEHGFSARELAELIWVICHQNILRFLSEVPGERQLRVRFEELVREPGAVMRGVSEFLGVEMHADMLEPHKDKGRRMTDGIHGMSRMLGDIKFHTHRGIDASAAERWKRERKGVELGEVTTSLAASLGYPVEEAKAGANGNAHHLPRAASLTAMRIVPRKNKARRQVPAEAEQLSDE